MGIVFGKTGVAEPAYAVLSRSTSNGIGYEVRSYCSRIAIQTPCNLDNKSFMTLAGYIGVTKSPQNSANESIAMTAPVSKSGMDGDTQMMSFILPASYTSISAVPAPTDPAVTVVELPPQYGAVHKFSGWVTDSQARSKLSSLLVHLNDDGVTIPVTECNWELWQYNPPFTIPWCRRNEVFVELTKEQAEGLGK